MMRLRSQNRRLPPTATTTPRSHKGFTLIELLVSMALMIVLMISISEVFSISSDSATRIAADAEILAASAAFRETVSDQMSKMTDGLLVIDCPAPMGPSSQRAEIRGGDRFLRLRHDRLVFMTHGDIGEYQSFTDPTRGDPTNVNTQTAGSAEALVYFGPGIPLSRRSIPATTLGGLDDVTLTASEWVFLHRSILLMLEKDANADPSWTPPNMDFIAGGMLNGGNLPLGFLRGRMDAVVSGNARRANTRTVADIILAKPFSDLLSDSPSIEALWQPSLAPRSVTLANIARLDHYTRSGSSFVRHMADFRIDWTDGRRIDPLGGDLRTRWFGLRPDPDFNVSNGVLNSIATTQIPNIAVRRQDVVSYGGGRFADSTQEEVDAFSNKIEWVNTTGSAANTAYRAIWRGDTWRFRPKALRFTYRIYDGKNRLKQAVEVDLDEDGRPDPDGSGTPRLFTRFGRRFSVVVMLP